MKWIFSNWKAKSSSWFFEALWWRKEYFIWRKTAWYYKIPWTYNIFNWIKKNNSFYNFYNSEKCVDEFLRNVKYRFQSANKKWFKCLNIEILLILKILRILFVLIYGLYWILDIEQLKPTIVSILMTLYSML